MWSDGWGHRFAAQCLSRLAVLCVLYGRGEHSGRSPSQCSDGGLWEVGFRRVTFLLHPCYVLTSKWCTVKRRCGSTLSLVGRQLAVGSGADGGDLLKGTHPSIAESEALISCGDDWGWGALLSLLPRPRAGLALASWWEGLSAAHPGGPHGFLPHLPEVFSPASHCVDTVLL